MTDWQPIETAPKKDETEILLYCHKDNLGWIEVGFWADTIQNGYAWTEGRDLMPLPATHWMPLPEPPKED